MWDAQCLWRRPRLYPRPSECSVGYIGRVYGIEAIEYPERASRGVLLSAGTGLMLSVMDQCPRLRWCLDVDGLTRAQADRLGDWLVCIGNVTELVAVAGWYCSTNPMLLAVAVSRLRHRAPCYVQCRGVGGDAFEQLRTAADLDAFIAQIRAC